MATGVGSIDEQHQELIRMINKLHRSCRAGAGKEELQGMMNFLAEYVGTHFQTRGTSHGTASLPEHGREPDGSREVP